MKFTVFNIFPLDWTLPVNIVNLFFIFYCVHLRLQVFVGFVRNNDCRVLECLGIYKSIVDTVENIKKPFDFLYATSLLVLTPNLIITTYLGLIKLKNHGEINLEYIADFLTRGLYCLQDFTLLFVPAVSAGILTYRAQQLLLMLHDRLLQERSEDHADDIELFIDYVEARPLALTVFEVIRLDWSLPVLVLNLCITYQIVVVQLTHIY
ncbi:hypothetical protein ABMA28_009342 [Loxostege sticticalis]|uniref:Gustatory receptor n=1 Tax=Loxostege sticticalis TaxID=481309 RepID=A0ABD0SGV2_LOXSC